MSQGMLEPRSESGQAQELSGDEALLEAALAGSTAAWETLQRSLSTVIGRVVGAVVRRYGARVGQADLEDMVAEVWLALLTDDCRKLRQFDPQRGTRLQGWVAMIAAQSAVASLRALPNAGHARAAQDWAQLAAPDPERDAKHSARALQLKMRRAMLQLSREDRVFLRHYLYHRGSTKAVAQALGISPNAVYTRKSRITARLNRAARAAAE